ncbi:GAF domain-containing protein [Zoogloea sp.]|uniref:GAF domain-containing protein n=1 Tax=Zoogloea sp. TaxID=49181 RepID=UPI001416B7CF|nr:MAG: GAF domain-containing protein [Zoogloea sp.]
MHKPASPPAEDQRLQTLRELLLLDTAPEARFDAVTAYAAFTFKVGISLVTLVDSRRQWFKSAFGLDVCETSREVSFCAHVILQDEIFEIPDAREDPAFFDNPLVTGEPFIRFYAGYPLTMDNGAHVGTLCLIDREPKRLSDWEREHLIILARMVTAELQGRPGDSVEGHVDLGRRAPG